MRRLTLGLIGALALVFGIASIQAVQHPRLAASVARSMTRAVGRLGRCAIGTAFAGENMTFNKVAPESAQQIEKRMRTHRQSDVIVVKSSSVDTLRPIALPVPPDAPDAPNPPDLPSRSGEMMRIGSDIHIEKDQTVVGDVVAISGDVTVDGHVKGDVTALRGDVYLGSSARVDGDVACIGGELHEESGAVVGGQRVTALSGRDRDRRIDRRVHDAVEEHVDKSVRNLGRFGRTLAWLLVVLGLIWLAVRIAGGRTAAAVDVLRRETAASLGIGMLAWVLIVPSVIALCLVVAILCITIIGIPVALAALLAYAVLLVLLCLWGFVVGAAWLGEQAGRKFLPPTSSLMRMSVYGAILIIGTRAFGYLLHLLPGFGVLAGFLVVMSWIASGIITTLGAGSLLRSEFATGLFGRWWRGARAPRGAAAAAAASAAASVASAQAPFDASGASVPTPGVTMAPPAPPAPPSAYTPPPPAYTPPPPAYTPPPPPPPPAPEDPPPPVG